MLPAIYRIYPGLRFDDLVSMPRRELVDLLSTLTADLQTEG